MQPLTQNPIQIRDNSSYMGEADYIAYYKGQTIKLRALNSLSEYRRQIYNGGPEAFDREVAPILNCAWIHNSPTAKPPADLIDALNAFRASEHAKSLAKLTAEPERYGEIAANDPIRIPPAEIRGAYLDDSNSWIILPRS